MTTGRRLKIAYLCDISPLDRNLYSGGNAHIYDALQEHVGDVHILSNSWHAAEPLRRLCHALPEAINLRLRWRLNLAISRIVARGVQEELRRKKFDVLFGAYSFQSLAGLEPPYSLVTAYTADATPTTYKRSEIGQSFGSYFSLARRLDPWIERSERSVLRAMDVLLWPSEWLKSSVDALHDLDPERSLLVPWGANIPPPEPERHPPEIGRHKPVRLLIVGRDWFAKGGPLVIETIEVLRDRGVDARLDVVGCEVPAEHLAEHVIEHDPVDKSRAEDVLRFEVLMRSAHFLFQPSFESYGFAFCEASAYGLPSICLRVGGAPVENEVNGHALPLGSRPADFADLIEHYAFHPDSYAALRRRARRKYETELNWDAWGRSVSDILLDKLDSGAKRAI